MQIGDGNFWLGDCFDLFAAVPDNSVDMILCDLPYGTTANKWDSVLPFDALWREYWRVCKPNAAVVLTAAQPFTSALVMSDVRNFRYAWVWAKNRPSGFANAKKQPLRAHEDVLVFARATPLYKPQGLVYAPKTLRNSRSTGGGNVQGQSVGSRRGALRSPGSAYVQEFTNYPTSILSISGEARGFHPTQKPVPLFEYLIRTYTNPGDLVLDNCAGSGTTAIAAHNAGRRWLCMEREPDYYWRAVARVMDHVAGRS